MYLKALESNIWKFTIILIANKRIFAAILGAYYLTIPNVTAQTIGLILLCGNIAGFIFEIPSGYLSDKLGHKQAIVLSRTLLMVSTFLFLVAENTLFLILGAVMLSIGWAFFSGTGAAFMHETLRGLGREDDYAKVMGKASSIGFAIPIIFMVLVPFLVSVSFKTPFAMALVVDVVGIVTALSLTSPKVTPEEVKEINATNFKQVIHEGYNLGFFRYAFFGSLIAATTFSLGIFRAPYQLLLEIPVIWFGVLFGIGRAIASLMLAYSGQLKNYFGNIVSFFKFQVILYTLLIILLAATINPWFVGGIFILINGFQWGLSQVGKGFKLEIIRQSKFKATLLSTQSQITNIFNGVFSFALGLVIENSTYQIAFFALAGFFLLTSVPMYWYIKRKYVASEKQS